jgi:hypothetical protein
LMIASDYQAEGGWYIRFGADEAAAARLASLVASAASCHVPVASITVHDGQTIVTTGPCWHTSVKAFGMANAAALWMPILP